MAATKTLSAQGTLASRLKLASYTVVGDTWYPAGGYEITFLTDFASIYFVEASHEVDHGLYKPQFDRTNNKLKLIDLAAAGAQVTTSTDVSNLTFYVLVAGLK